MGLFEGNTTTFTEKYEFGFPDIKGDKPVKISFSFKKVEFKFLSPIMVEGGEIRDLKKALERNPVDNLNLVAKVTY